MIVECWSREATTLYVCPLCDLIEYFKFDDTEESPIYPGATNIAGDKWTKTQTTYIQTVVDT